MKKSEQIGIVDIFAGPGGLSEGFASVGEPGSRPFQIALSIEKDPVAHRTLRLRSAVHEMGDAEYRRYIELLNQNNRLDEHIMSREFPSLWANAEEVAKCHELSEENRPITEAMLDSVREQFSVTGLIGGPPCQVYSLVGRSRNAGNPHYQGDSDHRHTLYQEYIHVLNYLNPAFFVMENVKGMLSSKHQSQRIFPLVRRDLESTGDGYHLVALAPDRNGLVQSSFASIEPDQRDFIVKMETLGVPQKRHRIIILGVRRDVWAALPKDTRESVQLTRRPGPSVNEMIKSLPSLRSGISKQDDSPDRWLSVIEKSLTILKESSLDAETRTILESVEKSLASGSLSIDRQAETLSQGQPASRTLKSVTVYGLTRLHHHETRSHIAGDIARYLFAAAYAMAHNRSPRAEEFPASLAPAHANWTSGSFNDRFRVQVGTEQSSTIMSHISKDGHYYIHPDPTQARSLTVREAARLQTFPDDYIFLGNRTQQYHQVGNAVPPYLAKQIATMVAQATIGDHS